MTHVCVLLCIHKQFNAKNIRKKVKAEHIHSDARKTKHTQKTHFPEDSFSIIIHLFNIMDK